MCEEVRAAWQLVKDDPDVNAVVLRAEGDRAFCAGLDTKKTLRPARRRLEPRGPRRAAQPQVAEGVEAGGVRRAGHLHRRRLLLPQRGRHRHLLDRRHVLRLARHLRHGVARSSRSGSCARSASPRRCAWRCRATTSGSRPSTALQIGLVTEVVEPGRAVGPGPRDRRRHRRQAAAPPPRAPSAPSGSRSTGPYRAAMEQGLIYTRLGNPIGMAEVGRAPAGREPSRGCGDASASPGLVGAHRRRPRHRPGGATPSSSTGAGAPGASWRHRRAGRRAGRPSPGAEVGILLRNRPASIGLLLGVLAGRRLRRHDQPRPRASSAPATTSPPSTCPCCAGDPADLAELVPDGRPRHHGRRRRPRRRRSPSRRAPTPAAGGAGPASPCGCSPAAPPARRSGSTSPTRPSSGCSSGAKHYESDRDASRAAAPPRRRRRELAARPPRRAVPRAAVRHRRPVVLAPRAVHRRRLGRRRPPPPPGHRQPRARRAAHGARGRPRPRRPRQPAVGRLGHGAARPRRRRRLHRALRRAGARSPTPPPSSAAAWPAGTSHDHRAFWADQAGERRPGPRRLRAAGRRPRDGEPLGPTPRACSR